MPGPDPKIIEEQSQRFYGLYERKAKNFRTALISVTGLVTIVFVLVFYPYVTFRGLRYVHEAELASIEREVRDLDARLTEHRQLEETFRTHLETVFGALGEIQLRKLEAGQTQQRRRLAGIRTDIGDDPDLRPWLSGDGAAAELPDGLRRRYPVLAPAKDDPCFLLTGEPWTRCALATQLTRLDRQIQDLFGYKRISHLRNDLYVPLQEELSTLQGRFSAWLFGESPGWAPDGASADGRLRDEYSDFENTYVGLIEGHERVIHEQGWDTNNALSDAQRQRKAVDRELKKVVARLEEMKNLREIQTPFGQLPVGLNELVLLFPVLVAAGFLLTASLLGETLQLRRVYHRLCRARDPDGELFDNDRLALIAPVWIDPLRPARHRVYRAAILAVPVLVFVTAILLLLDNRLLWGPFMDEARLGTIIYLALYAASALSILEGGRRVWLALRAYDTDPETTA
ncbi:MAG: hypothetical protein GY791_21115 [Alphaproteobacteria bacterium]|nr:hypothetical protein [Alphaproteobacteria bacterium]